MVYASLKYREPSKLHSEFHRVGRPNRMHINSSSDQHPRHSEVVKVFTEDYIYLTFESKKCLNVEVSISFGTQVDRSGVVKKVIERKNSD
jgi:hypothetical protein